MVAIKIGGPAGGAVDGKWNDGRAAVVVKIGGLAGGAVDGRPRLERLQWRRVIFGLGGVVIWKIARGTAKKNT